ncbi:fluoride efflux transporter FluC [Lapidilactobacillus bayanensis]|uniref:fluoride efflux transporter FluC n=1 Tax=Lapidilactobacillus bayanensis TaxID=2485998 RepID=UPI000F7AC156|nr:CrcB family protein [Lapidilactobacillus bayanensis]
MTNWVIIGLGASLGAVGRYQFTNRYKKFQPEFGYRATLIINLSGAFMLGLLFALALTDSLYGFLGVGFCGGWTTFSTLNSEIAGQIASEKWGRALTYIALTYGLGLPLCALGWWLGHSFFS